MKKFMDEDFILHTETAKRLYKNYAAPMPLVDYHCHISPREIYENRRFNNLVEVWLGGKQPDGSYFGDHYKWRVMRSNGVSEDYVTGQKPDFERFMKFVEALQMAIGNPMYHWCNLELHKYFGVTEALTPENAKEIWDKCADMLQNDPKLTVRGLIEQSNVAMVGTTDDPTDTLEWHEKIAGDPSIKFKVCPSFRPDKAINITKAGFADYIARLAESVGKSSLATTEDICGALTERLEFFKKLGCRASDHGLDYIMFRDGSMQQADKALKKALAGETLTTEEAEVYQTKLLLCLGRAYHKNGIAMQLHYNCCRNANSLMMSSHGPDTGFDTIDNLSCSHGIISLLDALDKENALPKTIIYSLNPNEDALIDTIIGAFQSDEIPGKIQHGSAWWFNDTKTGMENQMISLANLGLLGNFIGMLTDSRSFLSYTRHDYFRRIFCNLVGTWVENGEYPDNEAALKNIVEGVCYKNAVRYFDL